MRSHHQTILVSGFLGICAAAISIWGAGKPAPATATVQHPAATPAAEKLVILFSSSDGKKEWVDEVTADFNARGVKIGGKTVEVKVKHMRSGESVQKILAGEEKPVLWSPVSKSWIDQVNATWQVRHKTDFVTEVKPTVRTALVIAMWEPMARALGWPEKPVGWRDIEKVAVDPQGWARHGHPEWGAFKFGHSHPDFSTSAMLSLISLMYAETGKREGLTAADLKRPAVVNGMRTMQQAIVHYGESSSWLTEKICTRGPEYLSAVTLYESSVVKANLKYPGKPFPLVAIYPKEGTFWETHPTGIVDAEWVTAEMKEAATLFLDFLLAPEQQRRTMKSGFRPADASIALEAPIDRAHGADPEANDARALAPVDEETFRRANELWHQVKKKSAVYLVIDTSGSMLGEPMTAARRGAQKFLKEMEPDDEVKVISFANRPTPLGAAGKVRDVGEPLAERVHGLFAEGNTSLYDAMMLALDEVEASRAARREPMLYGIVVLSDGKDTSSRASRSDLLARLPKGEDTDSIKIHTIAYGKEADVDLLAEISARSNAVSLKGEEANVEKVYVSISSYF